MPKIPHSPIRMYFLLQPPGSNGNNQAESECRACGLRMKGNHASNMERHVRRSHPEIYEKYLELKQKTINAGGTAHDFVGTQAFEGLNVKFDPANFIKIKKIRQTAYQKQFPSPVTTPVINLQQLQQNILDACVELVTTNGRSLSLINDSGLQKLMSLPFSHASPHNFNVDDKLVEGLISEKASKLKQSILQNIKDKVTNVKVDITTVCNRSFMGINIFYHNEGNTCSYFISFNEINVRYDDNELESLIWRELSQFEITRDRVYCIVIDTGSNASALVSDLLIDESSLEINDVANVPASVVGDNIENVSCPVSFKMKDTISITEDSEANVRVITVFSENEDDENDLDWCTTEMIAGKLNYASLSCDSDSFLTTGMKCIADVLQITIYEALKSCEEIGDVVKEARQLFHKLSALNDRKIININLPSSISLVRWKVVFVMLEKIIVMKNGCIKLGVIGEDEPFWNQVEDLLIALKPCKMASDILHKEKLTIGDVYKVWFNCILETSKIDSLYAKTLTECMREKQVELFNDKTFLSALYLDPRFNNMILTDVQKKIAVDHLVACHIRFVSEESTLRGNEMIEINEEIDELERIFQLRENTKTEEDTLDNKNNKLEIMFKNFCESEPRLKTTESVLSFWEKKKIQYPDIYNLARIILSVPGTQKSFFKLSSQVQYAMNPDIVRSCESLFNDVILLRSNSEL